MFCSSCGNQLPEGSTFCPSCGTPVNSASASEEFENTTSEQTYAGDSQYNSQQYTNDSQYGNQQYTNDNQYSGQQYANNYQYGGQQYDSMQGRLNYKKRVLPFKITSAILNLIAVLAVAFSSLAAIGFSSTGFSDIYAEEWVEGFDTFGIIGVIAAVVGIILVILGFALPAKGGVACNLVNNIVLAAVSVWGVILASGLYSDVKEYSELVQYFGGESQEAKNGAVGLMAFFIAPLIFAAISLILSVVGLTRKKNY